MTPRTTIASLIDRYDAFLVDAYGVLIDASGPLPPGVALWEALRSSGKPTLVVTNDASKLESTSAERYRAAGVSIAPEAIVTSGSLLEAHFAANALRGARCLVLGPPDSFAYVRRAGGVPVGPDQTAAANADVLVIGDESGYDFLFGVDRALSIVLDRLDADRPLSLILPNPDLIYPKADGEFGIASGSIALLLERGIALRFGDRPDGRFIRLGKPHPTIFAAATERAGTRNALMIGDQLHTDIRGARAFGLDAALVSWGLTSALPADLDPALAPTVILDPTG